MKFEAAELFAGEKIEYFAPVSYSAVSVRKQYLIDRLGFSPRSVILFLVPYYTSDGENISSYAVSLDYHFIVGEIINRLTSGLRRWFPSCSFAGFTDHSPIDEISAAASARLGVIGENRLLINEKYGSYVFIASIFTDADCESLGCIEPCEPLSCIGCGRCAAACPTGTLRYQGQNERSSLSDGKDKVSAPECLSAITQKKGELSESELEIMRKYNTVWGCDVCQTVCPMNAAARRTPTPIADFYTERITKLDYELIEAMPEERFARRAYSFRTKAPLLRNLRALSQKE